MSGHFNRRGTSNNPRAIASTICQKCLGTGHFIYDCKNSRPYVSRPSRTKQLEDPKYRTARDKPSVEVPDEFKRKSDRKPVIIDGTADAILAKKAKERSKEKPSESKRSTPSSSGSASGSNSNSGSGSDSDSGSSSSRSSSSRGSRRSPRSRSQNLGISTSGRERYGRRSRSGSPVRRSASPEPRRQRD